MQLDIKKTDLVGPGLMVAACRALGMKRLIPWSGLDPAATEESA